MPTFDINTGTWDDEGSKADHDRESRSDPLRETPYPELQIVEVESTRSRLEQLEDECNQMPNEE